MNEINDNFESNMDQLTQKIYNTISLEKDHMNLIYNEFHKKIMLSNMVYVYLIMSGLFLCCTNYLKHYEKAEFLIKYGSALCFSIYCIPQFENYEACKSYECRVITLLEILSEIKEMYTDIYMSMVDSGKEGDDYRIPSSCLEKHKFDALANANNIIDVKQALSLVNDVYNQIYDSAVKYFMNYNE